MSIAVVWKLQALEKSMAQMQKQLACIGDPNTGQVVDDLGFVEVLPLGTVKVLPPDPGLVAPPWAQELETRIATLEELVDAMVPPAKHSPPQEPKKKSKTRASNGES